MTGGLEGAARGNGYRLVVDLPSSAGSRFGGDFDLATLIKFRLMGALADAEDLPDCLVRIERVPQE